MKIIPVLKELYSKHELNEWEEDFIADLYDKFGEYPAEMTAKHLIKNNQMTQKQFDKVMDIWERVGWDELEYDDSQKDMFA